MGRCVVLVPHGAVYQAGFNVLVIFRVMSENMHLVCPVALEATAKRLTINGFWHRSMPSSSLERPPETALVSPRAYGPTPRANSSPILVL